MLLEGAVASQLEFSQMIFVGFANLWIWGIFWDFLGWGGISSPTDGYVLILQMFVIFFLDCMQFNVGVPLLWLPPAGHPVKQHQADGEDQSGRKAGSWGEASHTVTMDTSTSPSPIIHHQQYITITSTNSNQTPPHGLPVMRGRLGLESRQGGSGPHWWSAGEGHRAHRGHRTYCTLLTNKYWLVPKSWAADLGLAVEAVVRPGVAVRVVHCNRQLWTVVDSLACPH
jgi:hypothetical protein